MDIALSRSVSNHIKALRPRQWTKNLVVFAAPLFAFSINPESFLKSLLSFILFCGLSSSFYLLNDIVDVESDRQHPVKCQRPIAAGLVSLPVAWGMAVVLFSSSVIIGWLLSPILGRTLLAYAVLQFAYNLRLKRLVIFDIGTIATGFVLRAYGGAVATGIVLSPWFIICTAMLALFLAIEKRKAELRLTQIKGNKPRAVLKRYSLALLSRMENTVTTCTVLTYALWSSGPQVRGASTSWMLLTLPFVLYGIFRYQLLTDAQEIHTNNTGVEQGGMSERPEEILLRDLPILLTVSGWILSCIAILWLKKQGLIQ